jgi:hypothetical protein
MSLSRTNTHILCLFNCELASSINAPSLLLLARNDDWLPREFFLLYISASDQHRITSSTSIGCKSALQSDVSFNLKHLISHILLLNQQAVMNKIEKKKKIPLLPAGNPGAGSNGVFSPTGQIYCS